MRDLSELRAAIDAVDRELSPLLAQRFALTDEVAAVKSRLGRPVLDATRETEVLSAIARRVDENCRDSVVDLYQRLLTLSKCRQQAIINSSEPTK